VYYGSKSVNVNDSLKSEQMTIQEIARRARVLVATVSRIISRVLFLRPAVIRSVHRVIREVGYYPNTNAGAVGSGVSYRCAQPDYQPSETNVWGTGYPRVDSVGNVQIDIKAPDATKVMLNFWSGPAAFEDDVTQALDPLHRRKLQDTFGSRSPCDGGSFHGRDADIPDYAQSSRSLLLHWWI
jgi:hypothetical protein